MVLPGRARFLSRFILVPCMLFEHLENELRQDDLTPAHGCLWLIHNNTKTEKAIHRAAYVHIPVCNVNILPSECEQFAFLYLCCERNCE